jgi:hypothetical protein
MKKLGTWLLFVSLMISLIPTFIPTVRSEPTTWCVSPTGDDNNSGDCEHPFRTIQRAVNVSGPSDTIYLRGGEYTPSGITFINNRHGTSTDWLKILAYPGEYPVINGMNTKHTNYTNATIEVENCSYVLFDGITINSSYLGGFTIRPTSSYIRFANGSISNCSGFAFKSTAGNDNISIENCYIYNNFNNWSGHNLSQETISFSNTRYGYCYGNYLWKNHCEQIDFKAGCSHCYIHNNRINTTASRVFKTGGFYCGGIGIYLDARGVEHNISIYNNTIWGNNTAIQMSNEKDIGHLENISVYNNVVNITNTTGGNPQSTGRIGILIGREGGSPSMNKDITIYMNTVNLGTGNKYPCLQIGASSAHMDKNYLGRLEISNNIFTNNNKTDTVWWQYLNTAHIQIFGLNSADGSSYIKFNNNLYNNSFSGMCRPRIVWQDAGFEKSMPAKWGNSPVFTKPGYVSPNPPFDPHLNATSPCINTATSSLVRSKDFDGLHRPQYGAFDIGAYEYPDIFSPSISIQVPMGDEALQDGVTLQSEVIDPSGVAWVFYAIREPGGAQGTMIDPMYEFITPVLTDDDLWQLLFDTTVLPDGNYTLFVNASDDFGNYGYATVNFSIRNWAMAAMLPKTQNNKAGRTIPVKFSLYVNRTVDPTEPFIWNEDLTIIIYEKRHPNPLLQVSTYGTNATSYRINSTAEHYITNFKTAKTPKTYVVEIWRIPLCIGSFEFSTVK